MTDEYTPSGCVPGLFYGRDGLRYHVKLVEETSKKERPISNHDLALILIQQAVEMDEFSRLQDVVRHPKYHKPTKENAPDE